jgi:hypothetical protein
MLGHLTITSALAALIAGAVAAGAGGAAGGVFIGGKVLGNKLAATMGVFYGLLAGFAGTVIGLIALAFIG